MSRNSKDIAEKHLESFNDVFSDIINVLIFNGEDKVKENELEDMKHALKENIRIQSSSDGDLAKLNSRVIDLRKQIVEIMNRGEN